MTFETVFFYLIAVLAIASAIMMITRRNPVISVMFLIVNFFCLAVLYLLLQSQFIAIIQILVYAGAIMVLFLFVIMLLNLRTDHQEKERMNVKKIVGFALASVAFIEIIAAMGVSYGINQPAVSQQAAAMGTVEALGAVLYTKFLFPFEITSLLLLAAMVGVVLMAKKKFE